MHIQTSIYTVRKTTRRLKHDTKTCNALHTYVHCNPIHACGSSSANHAHPQQRMLCCVSSKPPCAELRHSRHGCSRHGCRAVQCSKHQLQARIFSIPLLCPSPTQLTLSVLSCPSPCPSTRHALKWHCQLSCTSWRIPYAYMADIMATLCPGQLPMACSLTAATKPCTGSTLHRRACN
jgi:hypothetical protein